MNLKTIALYMRLSNEDDNLASNVESNSISHQRKLMLNYIATLPDLTECNIIEFSDDGYSGTDFNRPDFQKMMKLVKAGGINVIITKDYSRLGRDYLEVGNYMECIFPLLQIRYIAVNDNYDSDNNNGATGGMGVALKNIVNAMYCKDASRKVRSAKLVLAKQGKYIAAFAPYGYRKSSANKHRLEPDPEAAPVVNTIFEMAASGKKYTEIANHLNGLEYDSILEYYDKSGKGRNHCRDYGDRMWNPTSVLEVLYNEVYIGKVINNKVEYNLDTNHKTIAKDVSDWVVVENCHESLVTQELYNKAHNALGRRPYMKRTPTGKWKRALIVCGHCGKGMDKYNNGKSYRCHKGHGRINREELENNIVECMKTMAVGMLRDLEIQKQKADSGVNLESEIALLKTTLDRYSKLKFSIYDDYTKGKTTREVMAQKNAEVKQKIEEIQLLIEEKTATLQTQKSTNLEEDEECLNVLSLLDTYDQDQLRILISQVKVFDNHNIEIVWNVDDFYS